VTFVNVKLTLHTTPPAYKGTRILSSLFKVDRTVSKQKSRYYDTVNPGGGRRIFQDGKIREQSPSEGTLSCLTRVINLLHVKEPQVPKGNRWAKLRTSRPRS
jgi:hypothetical protein